MRHQASAYFTHASQAGDSIILDASPLGWYQVAETWTQENVVIVGECEVWVSSEILGRDGATLTTLDMDRFRLVDTLAAGEYVAWDFVSPGWATVMFVLTVVPGEGETLGVAISGWLSDTAV